MPEEQMVIRERGDTIGSWDEIRPVLEQFAHDTGYRIYVIDERCSYSRPREAKDENEFYLRLFAYPSSPEVHRETRSLSTVFGITPSWTFHNALTPNRDCAKTVKDEAGQIIAEMEKDTLFVLFNITDGPQAGVMMQKILDYSLAHGYLIADPKVRKEKREEQERVLIAQSGPKFREIFLTGLKQTVYHSSRREKELTDTEERYTRGLEDVRNKITEAKAATLRARRTLDHVDTTKEPEEMFEKLKKLSPTGNVIVRGGDIEIDMGHIDIEYYGSVYDIGDFTLVIRPSRGYVRMINRSKIVSGYFHPHVTGDGDPCLGNMSDQVSILVENMQYDVLVSLIMKTLRTYTPGDAYCSIDHWPVKEVKRKERDGWRLW